MIRNVGKIKSAFSFYKNILKDTEIKIKLKKAY